METFAFTVAAVLMAGAPLVLATLGATLTEKAGIIKPGVPVLSWVQQPEARNVVTERAAKLGCRLLQGGTDISVAVIGADADLGSQRISVRTPIKQYSELLLNLAGQHQARNAALAVAAAELLAERDSRITQTSIADGVANVAWPLRFEIFQGHPDIVLDAAHNPDSIGALVATFRSVFGQRKTRVLIFGSSLDKDAQAMLHHLLPEFTHIIVTEFQTNPRATKRQQLFEWATALGLEFSPTISIADTPKAALQMAKAACESNLPADNIVCVTGSIFLAAEVRELLVL